MVVYKVLIDTSWIITDAVNSERVNRGGSIRRKRSRCIIVRQPGSISPCLPTFGIHRP